MLNFVLPFVLGFVSQVEISVPADASVLLDASHSSTSLASSSSADSTSSSTDKSSSLLVSDGGLASISSSSFAAVVLPPAESTKPEDVFTMVSFLVKAVKNKNYTLAYGIVLMLLVYALRIFVLPKVSKSDAYTRWLPVISMLIASIPGIAAKFLSSGVSGEEVVTATLSIGMIAVGTWELAGKPINKALVSKSTSSTTVASDASTVEVKKEQ